MWTRVGVAGQTRHCVTGPSSEYCFIFIHVWTVQGRQACMYYTVHFTSTPLENYGSSYVCFLNTVLHSRLQLQDKYEYPAARHYAAE